MFLLSVDGVLTILAVLFSLLLFLNLRKESNSKITIALARTFIGVVFIYSGFVKAVDPLGSTYKFIDYFNAFGMSGLIPTAFGLAVFLSALEFIVGISLFFGVFARLGSLMALLFMIVFTPLTLVLAISNPVTDCGCFGDALILTNWQTFWKNIVIDIPLVLLLINQKKLSDVFSPKMARVITIAASGFVLSLSAHAYLHLPPFDFRPYKIGNNIKEGMSIPEGAKMDVYKNTFYYKNKTTGEEQTFSEDKIEAIISQPELWEYVKTESDLIEKGYHPPIHDFKISNDEQGDITEPVLADTSYTYMLVSYDLRKADLEAFKDFELLATQSKNHFFCLTAALPKDIEHLKEQLYSILEYDSVELVKTQVKRVYLYEKEGNVYEFEEDNLPQDIDRDYTLIDIEEQEIEVKEKQLPSLSFDFYICDPITLKTIVRANPGLVLLKGGTIVGKWHYNDFPAKEELIENKMYISK